MCSIICWYKHARCLALLSSGKDLLIKSGPICQSICHPLYSRSCTIIFPCHSCIYRIEIRWRPFSLWKYYIQCGTQIVDECIKLVKENPFDTCHSTFAPLWISSWEFCWRLPESLTQCCYHMSVSWLQWWIITFWWLNREAKFAYAPDWLCTPNYGNSDAYWHSVVYAGWCKATHC
jgi:hypothetical protein